MDLQEASINRPAGSPGQQNQEINTLKKQLDENRKQVKNQQETVMKSENR